MFKLFDYNIYLLFRKISKQCLKLSVVETCSGSSKYAHLWNVPHNNFNLFHELTFAIYTFESCTCYSV